jgi:hypothetical protein
MFALPHLPSGDLLPRPYRWIRAHGLRGITPWHFDYDDERLCRGWRTLYQQYTGKDAWPFAAYAAYFKTAAFPLQDGHADGQVIIVDMDIVDTWGGCTPGGTIAEFTSFSDWLSSALGESQELATEETLANVLECLEDA